MNFNTTTTTSSRMQIKFVSLSATSAEDPSRSHWWYEAPIQFSARGMDHLYMLVQLLMEWLQPPGLPDGLVQEKLFDDPELVVKQNQAKLFSHFWGTILCTGVALGLALIVPLLGFLICCCLCGSGSNTRAKSSLSSSSSSDGSPHHGHHRETEGSTPPRGKRHKKKQKKANKYQTDKGCDPCCRSFCGTHLLTFLLLITFFVICAFVTNEYVDTGLQRLPRTMNQSLDDVETYLNKTQGEVDILLRTNFEQLEQRLGESLDKSGIIVKNRLGKISHAVALDNLTEIVENLENIVVDLKRLSQETNDLRSSIHMLQKGLKQARENLAEVFRNCTHPICQKLKKKYRTIVHKLNVSTTLGHLPNLLPLMNNITQILNDDIITEVKRGKMEFDKISIKIQTAVDNTIPSIKKQIRLVKKELARTAGDINEALAEPYTDIREGKHQVYLGSRYIRDYERYRWYVFLGASITVLVILLLYYFGLLRGICKKQPTIQEYRNRRYTPHSTWPFKLGIILVFLFFGVLLLFTIAMFVSGSLFDRVACYYMEHPENEQAVKFVQILQARNRAESGTSETMNVIQGEKPNIAEVLSRCHQNMSIYRALQLYKYNRIQLSPQRQFEGFNISEFLGFKERYQIEKKFNMLIEQAYPVNPGPISLLSEQGISLIKRLRETSLGTLNFSSFADLIHQHVTPIDLSHVSEELNKEANLLPPSQIEHSSTLKNIALMLDSYDDKVVSKIKSHVVKLKEGAEEIEMKSQYGKKGLREALTEGLNEAKYAQHFLEHRGMREIKMAARGFVNDLIMLIDQYAKHVVKQVDTGVGRCEPVSRAVNATTVAICKEIVMPFNGYWFSMAAALLICLPATFCAAILSNLYPKLKARKEPRRLHDSDLNLDDEDDIPLQDNPAHKETTSHGHNLRYSAALYADTSTAQPSAPHGPEWSPGAPPPHIYTRPPPYNFN